MDGRRSGVTSFVHVGLVVEDLGETVRFLARLGFDCGEPRVWSGEWIDRIIGFAPAANRSGLRHAAFTVDDVRDLVDRVRGPLE